MIRDRPALEIEITPEMIEAVLWELRGFDRIESDYQETARDIIKAVLANLPPRQKAGACL